MILGTLAAGPALLGAFWWIERRARCGLRPTDRRHRPYGPARRTRHRAAALVAALAGLLARITRGSAER